MAGIFDPLVLFALGLFSSAFGATPPLRYAGLILFLVVVLKVFFVDLDRLDSFYRIIAFIILGILTLAGSFMYLKYRETFALEPAGQSPPG